MVMHAGGQASATAIAVAQSVFPLVPSNGTALATIRTNLQIIDDGANNTLAIKGATNAAETLSVYGDGTKKMSIGHDATNGFINASAGALSLQTAGSNRWNIGAVDTGDLCSTGNVRVQHGTSALAVSATTGFFHLQSCAGTPTGTPANIQAGQVPMVINSVTGQLCVYTGAVWRCLPTTMSSTTAAVGNLGGGTDDLVTYTLPANVLDANNKTLRITAKGTTANNVNAKTLTLNFGSQTVLTTALTTSIAGQWEIQADVVRTGSNTQDVRARTLQGATLIFDQEVTAGTQTDSGTIVIKCTGAATTDNDIVQESLLVEVLN